MGALGSHTDVISSVECGCEDASQAPGDSLNGEAWVQPPTRRDLVWIRPQRHKKEEKLPISQPSPYSLTPPWWLHGLQWVGQSISILAVPLQHHPTEYKLCPTESSDLWDSSRASVSDAVVTCPDSQGSPSLIATCVSQGSLIKLAVCCCTPGWGWQWGGEAEIGYDYLVFPCFLPFSK